MAAETAGPADWHSSEAATRVSPVRMAVYELCSRIPRGKVATYGAIAAALEPNRGARAVGSAMRGNPFSPHPVPCHRVVRADFSMGGFSGSTDQQGAEVRRKVRMLAEEGVQVQQGKAAKTAAYTFTATDRAAAAAVRASHHQHGSKRAQSRKAATAQAPKRAKPAVDTFDTPAHLRAAAASGSFSSQTSGQCPGFAQANLVVLPAVHAADFKAFCDANPQACPLLEMGKPGVPFASSTCPRAPADVRQDVPKYRLHRAGKVVGEVADIMDLWQGPEAGDQASVFFLLGCSFSFEAALQEAGLPLRHVQLGRNVPMYRTSRPTVAAGVFKGPLVVSMRPMTPQQAKQATDITQQYPRVHGAPVHVGDAAELGIEDLSAPDYGEAVPLEEGEVPVFWACGVTPQAALEAAALPDTLATHAPGHMLVLDVTNAELQGSA